MPFFTALEAQTCKLANSFKNGNSWSNVPQPTNYGIILIQDIAIPTSNKVHKVVNWNCRLKFPQLFDTGMLLRIQVHY